MACFGYRKIKNSIKFVAVFITVFLLHILLNRKINIRTETFKLMNEKEIIKKPIDTMEKMLKDLGDAQISESLQIKREFIKNMTKKAWATYEKYAWGDNEVNVDSLCGNSKSDIFYSLKGVTIVDSLDTLFLMGLKEEFDKAQEWVYKYLNFQPGQCINLFEANIRITGGLLSTYYLTKNELFLKKALELVNLTLPLFSNIFPLNRAILTKTNRSHKFIDRVCLSEIGTLHLEYAALSYITGNEQYIDKVRNIRNKLFDIFNSNNRPLLAFFYQPQFDNHGFISIGPAGDSFYEYLIKSYVQSDDDKKGLEFFQKIIPLVNKNILSKTKDGYYYYGHSQQMESLACFTGGMFGVASRIPELEKKEKEKYFELAKELTKTCAISCKLSKTNLCPEIFNTEMFSSGFIDNNPYYLRPEVIESLFVLYRITKDEIYREWGWNIIQGIEKHCHVNGGYSSVSNVNKIPTKKYGVQESFFLAETLKYAYLLFSDSEFISLDEWVFNTEGHPFKRYFKNDKK